MLEKRARANGQTLSEWVRDVLLAAPVDGRELPSHRKRIDHLVRDQGISERHLRTFAVCRCDRARFIQHLWIGRSC
jgi:hypothetical protein